ncbi:MAG TPA: hypothetical protein VFO75_01335 [Candidatus Dormibacteraeota bacterium]|nr:hypothetical protein [Candidatus Dormibacteraeota bacterium]
MGTSRRTSAKAAASTDAVVAHVEREDPETASVEIARTWETAYSELVDFESRLLDRVRKRMPTLSEAARHEAELTNLPMIVEHLQTFKYRLSFWRRRRLELEQQGK